MPTYTLSFEEFFEVYQNRAPTASFASLCAIGIASLIFTGPFLLLASELSPGVVITTGMLFVVATGALMIFPLGYYHWTVRRRGVALKELQVVYEQLHSRPRELLLDEDKWTLQTPSGKQEVRWKPLLGATELQNVISVAAPDQSPLIVPKRSLTAEQVDFLRRIAINGGEKPWSSSVGFLDYSAGEFPSLWRERPVLLTAGHVVGLLFFLFLVTHMTETAGPYATAGWVISAGFLFLVLTVQFWYLLIKFENSDKQGLAEWEVQFSERGTHFHTQAWAAFVPWSGFRKIEEGRRSFFLRVDDSIYYVLPKRWMPTEEQAKLRRLITDRFKAKTSKH